MLKGAVINAVAAIGDAADPATWSGIPARFLQAGRRHGWPLQPWRLDWPALRGARWRWNAGQLIRGRGWGGFQYSDRFLDRAEAAIPEAGWSGRILTFNQHFPRAWSVSRRGGKLVCYVDATFASFCAGDGLAARLPARVRAEACRIERDNFQAADLVVTMARWAADSVVADCGVPAARVATILPGANLDLPAALPPAAAGWPGRDRPLVLGFVGKDWRRKGLPFLLDVREALERRGVRAEVRCAGFAPRELGRRRHVTFAGFIDKARRPEAFVDFLRTCDLGCLFSTHEPLGISTLEFLRVGVPVAGFAVEGLNDTLPPGAGFRFDPATGAEAVADTLAAAYADAARIERLQAGARMIAGEVTWGRCVNEWQELLDTGGVSAPLQLWRHRAA